jgi:hypothetical protein
MRQSTGPRRMLNLPVSRQLSPLAPRGEERLLLASTATMLISARLID